MASVPDSASEEGGCSWRADGGHTHTLPAGWSHLPVPRGLAGLVTHSLLLNYGFLSLCPINMLVLVFIFVTHVVL